MKKTFLKELKNPFLFLFLAVIELILSLAAKFAIISTTTIAPWIWYIYGLGSGILFGIYLGLDSLPKLHAWCYKAIRKKSIMVDGKEIIFQYAMEKSFHVPCIAPVQYINDTLIVGVAILHPSGVLFVADKPFRHHHLIRAMSTLGMAGLPNTHNQGFLTNAGRFVHRYEAFHIARNANQILKKHPPEHILFSEDIWETP